MEALLNILLWGGVFFLMMRFGCGSHAKGHGRTGNKNQSSAAGQASLQGDTQNQMVDEPGVRWIPPLKDTDPVCGKTVATDKARSTVYDGKVYYFCSRDCREIFEAAPDLYVGATNPEHPEKPELEHSHA